MDWLDMLILFLGCIVEVFLIYDYFNNFFEIRIPRKYIKIAGVGTVCAVYFINLLQNSILNLIVVPVLLWLFVTLLFDAGFGIRLVYFMIAYIVMVGVEFLYVILSDITMELLVSTGLIPASEYLWQLLLIKLLNYIVFLILKQTSAKAKCRMTNKLFLTYLCVPVSTLGTMLMVFYSGIDVGNNTVLKILMTLFFAFMLVGNMLLFYAFQKYAENLSENAKQQLEILSQKAEVERLTKIAELNENYHMIVHNTSHYLKVIRELAYEGKTEEICNVVDQLNGTLNRENVHEYSNHKMLNTILSEYCIKAEKVGVTFDIYVEPGCILTHIQDMDLITIVGNLLDNAILAASKKHGESSVVVRVFMQKDGKLCVLKVVNDFANELKEIRGKLISTKTENGIHGIGITSVSKIAEQYDGYLEHYVMDEKFHAVVVLPI